MVEPVSQSKKDQLLVRMKELGIRESDLDESFILGSGSGGQKINKTASCVQLRHRPTGLDVKCQKSRSQEMNRFLARRDLCDKIEEKVRGAAGKKQQEAERIRRQKRRRSRRQQANMLADKHRHSEKKTSRRAVSGSGD
ncbi:MAG: peptide chain release factor-like protein [Kiritimatiellia bacterium]